MAKQEISSRDVPTCRGCFMQYREYEGADPGCRGLIEVPLGKCSFYKTAEEQEESLKKAHARQIKLYGQILHGPAQKGCTLRGY